MPITEEMASEAMFKVRGGMTYGEDFLNLQEAAQGGGGSGGGGGDLEKFQQILRTLTL